MMNLLLALSLAALPAQDPFDGELPLLVVERAGTVLAREPEGVSYAAGVRVHFAPGVLATRGDEAALIVRRPGVYLDFEGQVLRGAEAGTAPDQMDGIGVRVEADHVTLENLVIEGYRVGILAHQAHGLSMANIEVRDGYRQRLRSTYEREHASDWLFPHQNDAREWRRQHGAAIAIENTVGLLVNQCRARRVQNGLVLDRVEEAVVSSNDFSYLSGWGLALWRSSGNMVSDNRFDFCVRGYAHGRYNRGQDSAGILLFEQSSHNHFQRNSATHGGDGVFGFAGREALGEAASSEADFDTQGRGANQNTFESNDLSYAAAHGLELTFSFGNRIVFNRLVGNAITGLWLGYARDTLVEGNFVAENGQGAYGMERGGLNGEHAQGLLVRANVFADQPVGVRFWTDPDEQLARLPWVERNGRGAERNRILDNRFERSPRGVELVGATATELAHNLYEEVALAVYLDDAPGRAIGGDERTGLLASALDPAGPRSGEQLAALRSERLPEPSGLQGRQWIAIGEWGPHDWELGEPWLQPLLRQGGAQFRLLGAPPAERGAPPAERSAPPEAKLTGALAASLRLEPMEDPDGIALGAWRVIAADAADNTVGSLVPFELTIELPSGQTLVHRDQLVHTPWRVKAVPTAADPRRDREAFRAALDPAPALPLSHLQLGFGAEGPAALLGLTGEAAAALGADHFGVEARCAIDLPAGSYALDLVSDDGVAVYLDGELLFEDWTHHAPSSERVEFRVESARVVELRIEHFELTGHAELRAELVVIGA